MADIRAFRGWRYNLARAGALSEVIAPPYDVIDESLSDELHARNDFNVVRLILNPIRPADDEEDNRYTRTARLLDQWRDAGVLIQERDPAVYVYHQTFDWEGRTYTRRGVMTRVRLEELGKGNIYPHEETMPGPKADRLKLFHATGMNLSQIFGLYPDEQNTVADRLDEAVRGRTPLEAVDHLEVRHRIWPVTDAETVAGLQGMLGPKPIFIADGHHRYETGWQHLQDCKAAGQIAGPDDPANFILMMLVGMSEPGLQIMPTHRLVTGIGDLDAAAIGDRLNEHFDIGVVGTGPDAGRETWKRIVAASRQDALGLGTAHDDTWSLATLRSPSSMDAVVGDHSATWKSLGVSILHRLVLDHCLQDAGRPQYGYVHLTGEVLEAMRGRQCQLACLVQPATVDHIRELSGSFEKMPAKSTYFYPKLASGLVFNEIK